MSTVIPGEAKQSMSQHVTAREGIHVTAQGKAKKEWIASLRSQ
jgi:hypothetical protein